MYKLYYKYAHFNSIKVRLKRSMAFLIGLLMFEFQFHKGTIKTVDRCRGCYFKRYFNSIKVRLKHTGTSQEPTYL